LGAPVQLPEVTSSEQVKKEMGNRVAVIGQLERVPIAKGKSEWQGTALVLDDDTIIYVTYTAPPAGWESLIGARVRVEGMLRPSISEHEQSLLAPHLRDPATPKKAERSKLTGRVRVSGLAQNAKGGAVLIIDGSPYYLERLDAWPAEVVGKLVGVSGKVVDKQYLPQGGKNAKGEYEQGAEGSQSVIESPTWRVIQESKK
jgi:hypothetical protein